MTEETYGISYGGREAEREYIDRTGALPAPAASIGDVLLEDYPVEIKRATSSTLNQVRAVKYIPVVAYSAPQRAWYVIPAHIVVAEISRKTRGQHSEIPFESATLSLARLRRYDLARPMSFAGRPWMQSRPRRSIRSSERKWIASEMRHELLPMTHSSASDPFSQSSALPRRRSEPPRRYSAPGAKQR